MAPKRSAPPPPPPAASSEETDSGSGSEEEEEEEEKENEAEIAHSPPPVALTVPPQHKEKESESSDEDEDGEEEEEDSEEEEEDEKANHVIPSSATKNPPPLPAAAAAPTREESESSDEEEEEEEADEKVPQTKPAPKQNGEVKGTKWQATPFQRIWSIEDEFRILQALAAHRLEHGTLPQTEVLADAISGKLDNNGSTHTDLKNKVRSMQTRHTKLVKRGAPPSKDQDHRLFDLGNNVWPSATKAATKVAVAANSAAGWGPAELYPYLAEELKAVEKEYPVLFKREFAMIDNSTALALDEKIKKQRHEQMKVHMRHIDLIKESTKALTDLTKSWGGLS